MKNIRKRVIYVSAFIAFCISLYLLPSTYAATYDWTKNPEFDNGDYWVGRVWWWNFFTGGFGTLEPNSDYAILVYVGGDYRFLLRADTDMDTNTVCAGVTQGWVWDDPEPPGIYKPPLLQITSSIKQLWLNTTLTYYTSYPYSLEWGVLTNVWFKVYNVVEYDPNTGESTYYPETVLGIDFYYAIGGILRPFDGQFTKHLPSSMVYTRYYTQGVGSYTINLLDELINACNAANSANVYFAIGDCWLAQVEDVAEECIGYCEAEFSRLRVWYENDDSGNAHESLMLLIWNGKDWQFEGSLEIIGGRNSTDVHVISSVLAVNKGVYKLKFKQLNRQTSLVDRVILIAINKDTNKGFALPLTRAYHTREGIITKKLRSSDDIGVNLEPGETIELWFKPKNTTKG
ncbi:MAG: hypothetical protein NDF54_09940, partial [archaeon GB-1867-035]|nr:hypothetical protein [Candidatus Culexmicrobium profundum]